MIELALRVNRKIGAAVVALLWGLSAVLAFCLPATPRIAEIANLSDDVSLAATVAFFVAWLGRAHIKDFKWALTDAEDRADKRLLTLSGRTSGSD